MLKTANITAVLPVQDVTRAAAFYRDSLGLTDRGDLPDGTHIMNLGAGALLELMPVQDQKASAHTVLSFEVDDVGSELTDLESRGVTFEDYDIPEAGIKTVDHVATLGDDKAAWFCDSEGNILCIHQGNFGL